MKKSLSFIIILISLISCGNPIANYDNKKDNKLEIITEGIQTVNCGLKSSHVDVNDNNTLTNLWKEITSNKEVYPSSSLNSTSIIGRFDANSDYIENGRTRTKFKKCYVYKFENKAYLSAVYWDNKTGIGMRIRYRLIIINDKGEEHAWYGGGEDINILPDKNTDWVKYDFLFGYLKVNI